MRVFITGLNGFIASHLAGHLATTGHDVTGSSRTASTVPGWHVWKLGESIDVAMLTGQDVLIHCAHDFERGKMAANIAGTLTLADAARGAGVGRQIFVSSLSARADALSEYGRSKYEIERVFLDRGDTVVRPGMVIGKGGTFGKMVRMLERSPVLPLVDGGRAPTTLIGIADLCGAMESILVRSEPREYNLYYPERPSIKQVLVLVGARLHRRTLLVPVPAWALRPPLALLGWLRIPTPIDAENLRGYLKSKHPVHASNLSVVVPRANSVDAAITQVWPG